MKSTISTSLKRLPLQCFVTLLCLAALCAGMEGASGQGRTMSPDQIESLVAPVALYPDDLLTNVLTASTVPDRMNGDLNWTQNLGDTVINQMNDVLDAVQSFRSKAVSAGNLKTTEQQKVVTEENYIQIEPTNPDTIYVPQYIPEQVVNPGYPVATFAAGLAVSSWWHYNNVNWAAMNIAVNPLYLNHYNYRAGGYYANNLLPRVGYNTPGVWRPTPYAANASYARWGNTANINRGAAEGLPGR